MPQKFKYYLHDRAQSNELRNELQDQGVELSEQAWERIGRPFYEVALDCEVDDNGNVKILGIAKD